MTDYTKSTNFTSKDSLSTGNPLKIIKGAEFDTEFNSIATAIATKADLNSPTFIGTAAAPTAASGTNTTQIATTAFVKTAVDNYDSALTVATAQIEDSAVTTAKIADTAITTAKLADTAVTTAKITDANITTAKIADTAVTTAKIADTAITNAKITDDTITGTKIAPLSAMPVLTVTASDSFSASYGNTITTSLTSTSSSTNVVATSFTISKYTGALRFKASHTRADDGSGGFVAGYYSIYKNNTLVQQYSTTSSTPVARTDDISVVPGDVIEMRIRAATSGGFTTTISSVGVFASNGYTTITPVIAYSDL